MSCLKLRGSPLEDHHRASYVSLGLFSTRGNQRRKLPAFFLGAPAISCLSLSSMCLFFSTRPEPCHLRHPCIRVAKCSGCSSGTLPWKALSLAPFFPAFSVLVTTPSHFQVVDSGLQVIVFREAGLLLSSVGWFRIHWCQCGTAQ